MESISSLSAIYNRRFKVQNPSINDRPADQLCLVITIPAFKEPDIATTLASLLKCNPPTGAVEIIVGINAPEDSSEHVRSINQHTAEQITTIQANAPDHIAIHLIREESIPPKLAGAGYARKIVMDEALHRWATSDIDGPIVCLDADCTVSENYFVEIEKTFKNPNNKVGHLHFEHPYESESDLTLRNGIIDYEMHLRCYIQGLKWAGYPYAYHTVGSCMAVRASTYAKCGGMNTRKAGEDFYFMHKLAPLGGWMDIKNATVYPSCRVSDRVPFGTGKAQLDYIKTLCRETYNIEIYNTLATLFKAINKWYARNIDLNILHSDLRTLLEKETIHDQIEQMRTHSTSPDSFLKRWWQWMDGLKVLKMVHFLRDNGFPNMPVSTAARFLLSKNGYKVSEQPEVLLKQLRQLDRDSVIAL